MSSIPHSYPPGPGLWPVHDQPRPVPYDQPSAPRPPAYVDLTMQGTVGWTGWVPPNVLINGWPVASKFGRTLIPVPPGAVRVDVFALWTKQYGRASLAFHAAPGQSVPVFYALPYHVFANGAIGHVKQKRPGLAAIVVPLIVCVALGVLSVVVAVAASA